MKLYKIFIVDDESLIIKSLKASVDWDKYECEVIGEACDGLEAYELILQLKPDIVFTDIRMPGMSGLELIKKVGELSANILFVVISGYAEFAYAQKALSYGVLGYCLKPFDEMEIYAILEKARSMLEKLKASMEMELMGLIGDTDAAAHERIKSVLDTGGLELSDSKGIAVVVLVGQEELPVPNEITHVRLKIGSSRYAYLLQDSSLEHAGNYLKGIVLEAVKGIGISKVHYSVDAIGEAIEEAYIAANQYFMTGRNGIYTYEDYYQEELVSALHQLENAIIKKEIKTVRKALDMVETILSKGIYNIKHAFQIYNIIMYSFYMMHSERYESHIYDYGQLTHSFNGVHGMFEYLQGLLKEYTGLLSNNLPSDIKNETFRNILLYVNDHYYEDISIQTISREYIMNPSYVSQLFKKQTGATFTEYITNLRLNYACNLLKTTGFTINEVAEKVGFNDYYYFTRVFKKVIGKTPTGYRDGMHKYHQ